MGQEPIGENAIVSTTDVSPSAASVSPSSSGGSMKSPPKNTGRIVGEEMKKRLMEPVREQYSEFRDLVNGFQLSVSECVSKAEAEFLSAYRCHMLSVHKELEILREKLAQAQSSVQQDEDMQKLEMDMAWYREEAAQQTANIKTMEMDKLKMRTRISQLSNDRRWLVTRLKSAKKQQKLLKAQYHDAKNTNKQTFLTQQQDSDDDYFKYTKTIHKPSTKVPPDILKLRSAVQATKKEAKKLRSVLVAERAGLSDWEDFFSACINDVIREYSRPQPSAELPDPNQLAFLGRYCFPNRNLPWGLESSSKLPGHFPMSSPSWDRKPATNNHEAPPPSQIIIDLDRTAFDDQDSDTFTNPGKLPLDEDTWRYLERCSPGGIKQHTAETSQAVVVPPDDDDNEVCECTTDPPHQNKDESK